MTSRQPANSRSLIASFTLISSASAIGMGGLVLIGWAFGLSALKTVLPGRVAMNPTTAVCFMLAGTALHVLRAGPARGPQRRLARIAAFIVALVGAVKLTGYACGCDVGLDRLLFHAHLANNEIAPNTAASFFLVGVALLCLDYQNRRGRWPAQGIALVVAIGSVLSLVGYAFGAAILYGVPSAIPMALNTAAVFHLLALGILASRPDRGISALFLGNSVGGALARRLVPAAVAVPAVIGWLRLAGQQRGLFESELGVALMVAVTIVSLLLLILWTAETVNRLDAGRRQAEISLRESEGRFRLLVDSVQDYAIFMLDMHGRVTTWNATAQRITGYTAEEIIGQHVSRFFPSDAPRTPDHELRLASAEGRFEEEAWRQRKDGTRFWASVVITPIHDADGRHTGFAKVTRDITQRRNAERAIRELNQNLERRVAERTAELAHSNRQLRQQNEENEMFVYSVSHDLRSPLVNLQGFSKELEAACQDVRDVLESEQIAPAIRDAALGHLDQGMKEPIRFIQTAVSRLGSIIDALLRLSRAGRVEYHPAPVDVQAVLGRIVDSMRGTIAAREARVTVHDLPHVVADPAAVEQIFANLIGNALNYLAPNRPGRIEVGTASTQALEADPQPGTVTFYVRDNGCGIPAAHQPKIFRAFQRLRPDLAQGEGIGLAIVRRTIERHGGSIWLRSAADEGTTFFLTLPAADGDADDIDVPTHADEESLLCLTNQ